MRSWFLYCAGMSLMLSWNFVAGMFLIFAAMSILEEPR
jgi:hypothetical protein